MARLLMITGRGSAIDLASGKRGAFYNMLEEFHKYWERIDVITPKVNNPVSNIFGNVYIHSSPWPLIFHPIFFIKKALEIYKQQKFDLMTVHEFPPFYNGIAARLIWNKIRVPYVLEVFHIPGYPKAGNLKEKIYRRLFYSFIKYDCLKAKAVRVMNSQVRDKLVELGVPREKINLIPAIYIDLETFRPMDLEKIYDLIFVGRLVKNKGVNLFIDAVRRLGRKALVVGEGPLKESMKLKARKLGLDDKVIFHGWAKDFQEVAELLNQSKILVMPSYNEGGPRVVLEAMACGAPILATPVGIVPDIVKDGESGRLIDWSAEDIAEKIRETLNNEPALKRYASTGLEIAKNFEKKQSIRNYAEKLQNLI